jgi:thioredoxin-like negative regulator of GroEL
VASAVSFVEVVLQAPPEEGGLSAEDTLKKLQQAVARTPTDLEARHQLALKCFQLQRFEAAMNECLEVGSEWKGGREEGREEG